MTTRAMRLVRVSSVGLRSSGCSTFSTLAASSRTSSRTFSVYGLVPTARFSDFWNFAVAIICIVLVILRMFRTALRRFTIARALAMVVGGSEFRVQSSGFRVQGSGSFDCTDGDLSTEVAAGIHRGGHGEMQEG